MQTTDYPFTDRSGVIHNRCCVCSVQVSTHDDAGALGLAYCGECNKPTCAEHREDSKAARCSICARLNQLLTALDAGERAGKELKVGDPFFGAAVLGVEMGYERGTAENRLFAYQMLDELDKREVRVEGNRVVWVRPDQRIG